MNVQSMRYARQIAMPEIGIGGQNKLARSAALVIGAGGLGSPVLYYLAAAGVGRIVIVDFDQVDESNLNRQILHGTSDVGVLKVDSAAASLRRLNPEIVVEPKVVKITSKNISEMIRSVDLVLDAVDSFGSKFVINDACVANTKPFVHAGATGLTGQLYFYRPGDACLRCLFPSVPNELEGPQGLGILGATAGCIGTMQALIAIQYLTGSNRLMRNQLISLDGVTMRQRNVIVPKSKKCPVCS